MASMRQIRARIRTAKNIQQITKAMKMVAAARLRRAQESVESARPYSQRLREVMARLANSGSGGRGGGVQHPLLRPFTGTPNRIGMIVITGDRGLCGSFNSSAIRRANETLRDFSVDNVRLICVGRRGAGFFRRRGYTIVSEHGVPAGKNAFVDAREISREAADLFQSGDVDVVYLVYTQYVSAMTQRAKATQLLPVAPPEGDETGGGDARGAEAIEFEPSPEAILTDLVPRYVDTLVYQGILESTASFFGAQMTSMSSATDNAGKMISGLTLSLNRARQAAITKEIAEIVGGADALRG